MKKRWIIPLAVIGLILTIKVIDMRQGNAQLAVPASGALKLVVNPEPTRVTPGRVAINLGNHSNWGASQLLQNVLVNPGFEGTIDRIVVIPSQTEEWAFSDEENFTHPDGYWTGAQFDIRNGALAGTFGTITNSLEKGPNALPQYQVDTSLIGLQPKDAIVLTKVSDDDPTNEWWLGSGNDRLAAAPGDTPPDSHGNQSLRFELKDWAPVEVKSYLDHMTDRAGKLLPINGKWRFKVWMRAEGEDAEAHISFMRAPASPFLEETITPTSQWQEYTFEFDAQDDGPKGIIEFKIAAIGQNGMIWVDDLWLGPVEDNPTVFRQQVVDALKDLRPSFVRNSPLYGDTWENQSAHPTARRTSTLRIWNQPVSSYNYSVDEFLDLCAHVGANPWLTVSPTFTDREFEALGQFLAKNANKERFSEVIVEFGNENWNWMFRANAFPYPTVHGAVSERAFRFIEQGSTDQVNLRKVINGEHAFPWIAGQFLEKAPHADSLAVGPYFLNSLNAGTPTNEAMKLLFQDDGGLLAEEATKAEGLGKTMAIYEMNLHTSSGTAPSKERTPIVAGAGSGAALAKKILSSMFLGVDPIAVYRLAQFDTPAWDIEETVPIWGVIRDFGPPIRYRPTGLAIAMLNRVIGGNMYPIQPLDASNAETANLTMAAFRPSDGWTAAIVSSNSIPVELEVTFPDDNHPVPTFVQELNAPSPLSTNEEAENVRIIRKPLEIAERTVRVTVPACGCAVLGATEEMRSAEPTPEPKPLPPQTPKTVSKIPPEEARQQLRELRKERQKLNREFRQQQEEYQMKLDTIREEQQVLRDQLETALQNTSYFNKGNL